MMDHSLFSTEHIELIGMILIPVGLAVSGSAWYLARKISQLIWEVAQMTLKVDLVWEWFTNEGHEITGGDKYAHLAKGSKR